jgi:hypothetical protein
MWFVYASFVLGIIAFAIRKYGWNFHQRFGRPIFLRRIVGKTRPATPPLEDHLHRNNEHSVFQVFDDGTIISSNIEKPQMVIESEMQLQNDVDELCNSSLVTFE